MSRPTIVQVIAWAMKCGLEIQFIPVRLPECEACKCILTARLGKKVSKYEILRPTAEGCAGVIVAKHKDIFTELCCPKMPLSHILGE